MHDVLTDRAQFIVGREVVIQTLYGSRTEPTGQVTITAVEPRWNRLGGQWADITVRDAVGRLHELDTRNAFILSTEYQRDEWCPECRTGSSVEDEFTESRYERSGEYEFTVTKLACGHDVISGDHHVGAAPGAPYAGHGTVVAASTRPRDLHDAAVRSRLSAADDPWAAL